MLCIICGGVGFIIGLFCPGVGRTVKGWFTTAKTDVHKF
jgi:hypothetical protein